MANSKMRRSKLGRLFTKLSAAGLIFAVAFGTGTAIAQTPLKPLSANDVSILFPPPKTPADLAGLIAVSDLAGPTGAPQRLLSDEDFARFIANAEHPEREGVPDSGARRIQLPDAVKKIDAWFVAGIRIDPGAPGLSADVIAQFGRQPQIRLIIQPVTNGPQGFKVHDTAGHLIFSFNLVSDPPLDGCAPFPRFKPDDEAFKAIVRDVASMRDQLAAGKFGNAKVSTAGDMNVHPGLLGASAKPFRDAVKAFLEKHLSPQRLNTMAVMGISPPEPWVFVSMLRVPKAGLIPVPGPTLDGAHAAQMFSIVGETHVVPRPVTNNENPVTCRHAALQNPPLPSADRKGVSTADFIDANVPNSRVLEIVNVIADPKKSHFFNTDCVSCHTETAQPLKRKVQGFTVPGVNRAVLPKEDWNVRNFGWFPSFLHGGPAAATITRRAAAETADVVSFINSQLLNK
ncbi:hypothetical protein ACVIHI_008360 [Bradyrhizobium sp. USDA 4524]|uniref:hypothetical protein n=1 Tax=unclassified Bradyrhizobium TaxID=2631580 RepID=UPI00209C797E|nr:MULTISPECIES: hypothetical protein [unclassified Bradyrhizobium]MCP1838715.1 hypothetical protein [Bradyrhizobium sp. USDA 4538]MCP1899281.1 hypothetical protein [Bradyrhizobium sp. USDA 4537]MCP1986607.1 hypothetical protein [Bradyrhizobium sp. USDA 4539]